MSKSTRSQNADMKLGSRRLNTRREPIPLRPNRSDSRSPLRNRSDIRSPCRSRIDSRFSLRNRSGSRSPRRSRIDSRTPLINRSDSRSPLRNRSDIRSPCRSRIDSRSPRRNRSDSHSPSRRTIDCRLNSSRENSSSSSYPSRTLQRGSHVTHGSNVTAKTLNIDEFGSMDSDNEEDTSFTMHQNMVVQSTDGIPSNKPEVFRHNPPSKTRSVDSTDSQSRSRSSGPIKRGTNENTVNYSSSNMKFPKDPQLAMQSFIEKLKDIESFQNQSKSRLTRTSTTPSVGNESIRTSGKFMRPDDLDDISLQDEGSKPGQAAAVQKNVLKTAVSQSTKKLKLPSKGPSKGSKKVGFDSVKLSWHLTPVDRRKGESEVFNQDKFPISKNPLLRRLKQATKLGHGKEPSKISNQQPVSGVIGEQDNVNHEATMQNMELSSNVLDPPPTLTSLQEGLLQNTVMQTIPQSLQGLLQSAIQGIAENAVRSFQQQLNLLPVTDVGYMQGMLQNTLGNMPQHDMQGLTLNAMQQSNNVPPPDLGYQFSTPPPIMQGNPQNIMGNMVPPVLQDIPHDNMGNMAPHGMQHIPQYNVPPPGMMGIPQDSTGNTVPPVMQSMVNMPPPGMMGIPQNCMGFRPPPDMQGMLFDSMGNMAPPALQGIPQYNLPPPGMMGIPIDTTGNMVSPLMQSMENMPPPVIQQPIPVASANSPSGGCVPHTGTQAKSSIAVQKIPPLDAHSPVIQGRHVPDKKTRFCDGQRKPPLLKAPFRDRHRKPRVPDTPSRDEQRRRRFTDLPPAVQEKSFMLTAPPSAQSKPPIKQQSRPLDVTPQAVEIIKPIIDFQTKPLGGTKDAPSITAASTTTPAINLKTPNATQNDAIKTTSQPVDKKMMKHAPDGTGSVKFSAPDTNLLIFDPEVGYRYDTKTGLHYDANSGYFFNSKLQIFLYWDLFTQSYLRVENPTIPFPVIRPQKDSSGTVLNMKELIERNRQIKLKQDKAHQSAFDRSRRGSDSRSRERSSTKSPGRNCSKTRGQDCSKSQRRDRSSSQRRDRSKSKGRDRKSTKQDRSSSRGRDLERSTCRKRKASAIRSDERRKRQQGSRSPAHTSPRRISKSPGNDNRKIQGARGKYKSPSTRKRSASPVPSDRKRSGRRRSISPRGDKLGRSKVRSGSRGSPSKIQEERRNTSKTPSKTEKHPSNTGNNRYKNMETVKIASQRNERQTAQEVCQNTAPLDKTAGKDAQKHEIQSRNSKLGDRKKDIKSSFTRNSSSRDEQKTGDDRQESIKGDKKTSTKEMTESGKRDGGCVGEESSINEGRNHRLANERQFSVIRIDNSRSSSGFAFSQVQTTLSDSRPKSQVSSISSDESCFRQADMMVDPLGVPEDLSDFVVLDGVDVDDDSSEEMTEEALQLLLADETEDEKTEVDCEKEQIGSSSCPSKEHQKITNDDDNQDLLASNELTPQQEAATLTDEAPGNDKLGTTIVRNAGINETKMKLNPDDTMTTVDFINSYSEPPSPSCSILSSYDFSDDEKFVVVSAAQDVMDEENLPSTSDCIADRKDGSYKPGILLQCDEANKMCYQCGHSNQHFAADCPNPRSSEAGILNRGDSAGETSNGPERIADGEVSKSTGDSVADTLGTESKVTGILNRRNSADETSNGPERIADGEVSKAVVDNGANDAAQSTGDSVADTPGIESKVTNEPNQIKEVSPGGTAEIGGLVKLDESLQQTDATRESELNQTLDEVNVPIKMDQSKSTTHSVSGEPVNDIQNPNDSKEAVEVSEGEKAAKAPTTKVGGIFSRLGAPSSTFSKKNVVRGDTDPLSALYPSKPSLVVHVKSVFQGCEYRVVKESLVNHLISLDIRCESISVSQKNNNGNSYEHLTVFLHSTDDAIQWFRKTKRKILLQSNKKRKAFYFLYYAEAPWRCKHCKKISNIFYRSVCFLCYYDKSGTYTSVKFSETPTRFIGVGKLPLTVDESDVMFHIPQYLQNDNLKCVRIFKDPAINRCCGLAVVEMKELEDVKYIIKSSNRLRYLECMLDSAGESESPCNVADGGNQDFDICERGDRSRGTSRVVDDEFEDRPSHSSRRSMCSLDDDIPRRETRPYDDGHRRVVDDEFKDRPSHSSRRSMCSLDDDIPRRGAWPYDDGHSRVVDDEFEDRPSHSSRRSMCSLDDDIPRRGTRPYDDGHSRVVDDEFEDRPSHSSRRSMCSLDDDIPRRGTRPYDDGHSRVVDDEFEDRPSHSSRRSMCSLDDDIPRRGTRPYDDGHSRFVDDKFEDPPSHSSRRSTYDDGHSLDEPNNLRSPRRYDDLRDCSPSREYELVRHSSRSRHRSPSPRFSSRSVDRHPYDRRASRRSPSHLPSLMSLTPLPSLMSLPPVHFAPSTSTLPKPDGVNHWRYPVPDPTTFLFESGSNFQLDPETGLLYNRRTGLFLNEDLNVYLEYRREHFTYVRV